MLGVLSLIAISFIVEILGNKLEGGEEGGNL